MRTLLLCLCLALIPACKKRDTPLEKIAAAAVSPTQGRTAAAHMLVTDWQAGKVKLDDAIDLAFEMVESAKSGKPPLGKTVVPTSTAATEFAGCVLDATKFLDGKIPTGPEHEIFWMRVGGLAFAAAEEARANGRSSDALDLVLGGHSRWQNDAYWYMHPTHDGLVSLVMAENGRRADAVARLRQRADLQGLAAEVYKALTGGDY
jgi:hypothetical protein